MERHFRGHKSSPTLRYTKESALCIRRVRKGRAFAYQNGDGRTVRDRGVKRRIKALAIPPAWTHVRISAAANGHLQATGRDIRRRKQYLYHPRWREIRDQEKFGRILAFAKALPGIRRRVKRDLKAPHLTRAKVLAAVVRLLEVTCIRVGNEEYLRANRSFGLTTLRDRHVDISGERMHFRFRGKSGKEHSLRLSEARLARVVRRCQDLPGQQLFQYADQEGNQHKIDSGAVNEYLREISGGDFTAKDFRTWRATVLMAAALRRAGRFDSTTQARRNVNHAIKEVAAQMGNTPAICRKCYVHPGLVESYLDGTHPYWGTSNGKKRVAFVLKTRGPEETAVLRLLQMHCRRRGVTAKNRGALKRNLISRNGRQRRPHRAVSGRKL